MKIKMLVPMASPELVAGAGAVIEVSPSQAKPLIGGGYAELIEDEVKTEEPQQEIEQLPVDGRIEPEYENTVKRRGRPRAR